MINKKHFLLLAGNPEEWDNEMLDLTNRNQSLIDLQLDQARRGRLSAEMILSTHGWSIRYASALQNFNMLFGSGSFDPKIALEWGVNWVNKNNKNRELYVRKTYIEKCESKGYDCWAIKQKQLLEAKQ